MDQYRHFILYPGHTLKLKKNRKYIIGRDKRSDIMLSHQSVSREHALIQWKKDCFIIKDLNSTNGLFLNSRKVTEQQMLSNDKIRVGVYYLEYKTLEEDEDPEHLHKSSDTLMIENRVDEIIKEVQDPVLSDKILGLKHFMNAQKEKMASLAYIDNLTGLFNRRYFDEKLEEELERARRYDRDMSLLMMDIDHFKKINDTWGHQKGDEVLQAVSNIIKSTLRICDVPTRYGGEEMAVILPEMNLSQAYKTAEKIRLHIKMKTIEETEIPTTISIGIASYSKKNSSIERLIKAADKALYKAKQNGRNRCEADEQNI